MIKQICSNCGSDQVARTRWVNPNDDSVYSEDCWSDLEWCWGECQEETTIKVVVEIVDVPVAYFARDGSVQCEDCIGIHRKDPNPLWDGITPTRIFVENLSPYSQTCHVCSKMVYKGTVPNILFENKNEPIPDPNSKQKSQLDCTNCGHNVQAHSHDLDQDAWCTEQGCECKQYDLVDEPYEPVTKWDNVCQEMVICDDGAFKGEFDFVPDFYNRRFTDAIGSFLDVDGSMQYYIPILPSDREKYQHSSRLNNRDNKYVRVVVENESGKYFNCTVTYYKPSFVSPMGDGDVKRFDPHNCEMCSALTNAGYELNFIEAYHNAEDDAMSIAENDPAIRAIIDTVNNTEDEDENT